MVSEGTAGRRARIQIEFPAPVAPCLRTCTACTCFCSAPVKQGPPWNHRRKSSSAPNLATSLPPNRRYKIPRALLSLASGDPLCSLWVAWNNTLVLVNLVERGREDEDREQRQRKESGPCVYAPLRPQHRARVIDPTETPWKRGRGCS